MFTGLIREIARVDYFDGRKLTLAARHRPRIGDSIAINGVCLSVVEVIPGGFSVEVGDETRERVALENFQDRVHMEPALQVGDRLEGHIVQGHIDAIGTITAITPRSNAIDFQIQVPPQTLRFIIPKGSIAIDGVSLTINERLDEAFRVTIVPITLRKTLFGSYQIGRRVNIETDMFARYLYHLFAPPLTWEEIDHIHSLF
ncbi:MAG: riboflavin synthase [Nitratiruptor sp.]|nr:riboflavin synthase [Nitratiruptor sp.]NPA83009.1 riboflavin synthase [Campylobacterota bacterium]